MGWDGVFAHSYNRLFFCRFLLLLLHGKVKPAPLLKQVRRGWLAFGVVYRSSFCRFCTAFFFSSSQPFVPQLMHLYVLLYLLLLLLLLLLLSGHPLPVFEITGTVCEDIKPRSLNQSGLTNKRHLFCHVQKPTYLTSMRRKAITVKEIVGVD